LIKIDRPINTVQGRYHSGKFLKNLNSSLYTRSLINFILLFQDENYSGRHHDVCQDSGWNIKEMRFDPSAFFFSCLTPKILAFNLRSRTLGLSFKFGIL